MKALKINCPICDRREWRYLGTSSLYIINNKFVSTDIYQCKRCGVLFREADENTWWQHFQCASYTLLDKENENKQAREGFFKYILKLLREYLPLKLDMKVQKVLDIGCSYGHLLDILKKKGLKTYGVETNESLYQKLNKDGKHQIYHTLYEIQDKFEIITFIDSLYYFKNPSEILGIAKDLLARGGVILCRVTNRVWLIKLFLLFHRSSYIPYNLIGDARWSFSPKSLKMLFQKVGFSTLKFIYIEKEKNMGYKKSLFYLLTQIISLLTPLKLCPGIICIAKK